MIQAINHFNYLHFLDYGRRHYFTTQTPAVILFATSPMPFRSILLFSLLSLLFFTLLPLTHAGSTNCNGAALYCSGQYEVMKAFVQKTQELDDIAIWRPGAHIICAPEKMAWWFFEPLDPGLCLFMEYDAEVGGGMQTFIGHNGSYVVPGISGFMVKDLLPRLLRQDPPCRGCGRIPIDVEADASESLGWLKLDGVQDKRGCWGICPPTYRSNDPENPLVALKAVQASSAAVPDTTTSFDAVWATAAYKSEDGGNTTTEGLLEEVSFSQQVPLKTALPPVQTGLGQQNWSALNVSGDSSKCVPTRWGCEPP